MKLNVCISKIGVASIRRAQFITHNSSQWQFVAVTTHLCVNSLQRQFVAVSIRRDFNSSRRQFVASKNNRQIMIYRFILLKNKWYLSFIIFFYLLELVNCCQVQFSLFVAVYFDFYRTLGAAGQKKENTPYNWMTISSKRKLN